MSDGAIPGRVDGGTVDGVHAAADIDPDHELAELAATGDPDAPLPDDAVSLWDLGAPAGLLPSWYMPAPAAGTPLLRGWRRAIVWIIVIAFLGIVAAGLCSTYGEIVVA